KPGQAEFALPVLPVVIKENDAAKQIIIKEETAGIATIKIYNLSFENGNWVLQPEWLMTAKEIIADSLPVTTDSLHKLLKRVIPAQQ
ncbi:MAG: hypothetical protein WBP16_01585, partial [Ferruginibacter sp.]